MAINPKSRYKNFTVYFLHLLYFHIFSYRIVHFIRGRIKMLKKNLVLSVLVVIGVMSGCGTSGYSPKLPREDIIENINNYSESEQIRAVSQGTYRLKRYPNRQYTGRNTGQYIQYIHNPSEKVQLAAVQSYKNGFSSIKYIKNPSEKVQLAAIKKYEITYRDKSVFANVPLTEKAQIALVRKDGRQIEYIKNPSEKVQIAAVTSNCCADGRTFKHIKNPSKAVQLAAVNKNGRAIYYIENPDKEVQLAAVKQNAEAIKYIKNPSKEFQLAAVKQNAEVMKYIKNPDKEFQLAAVKQNTEAIKYIKDPYPEVLFELGRSVDIPLSELHFLASNKDISIEVYNGSLKISNYTKQFLKILSIAEYNGDNIHTLSPLSIPPEGIKTLSPYTTKIVLHSINEKVVFGYAIEYKVGNSATKNLYKTKKYSFKDFQ